MIKKLDEFLGSEDQCSENSCRHTEWGFKNNNSILCTYWPNINHIYFYYVLRNSDSVITNEKVTYTSECDTLDAARELIKNKYNSLLVGLL